MRAQVLVPAIKQLGRLCIDAVRFRNLVVYEEAVERLGWTYDLGRQKDTGAQASIESKAPSLDCIAQLYIVGAYAAFRNRLPYVQTLLSLHAHDRQNNIVPVVFHPHWRESWSGDSTPSRFEQARADIVNSPELLNLFLGDQRRVAMSLSQFDFLASFYLHLRKLRYWTYFTQYSKLYVTPTVEMLLDPAIAQRDFVPYSTDDLAEFLRSVDREVRGTGQDTWFGNDWPKRVADFFQQHPVKGEHANLD